MKIYTHILGFMVAISLIACAKEEEMPEPEPTQIDFDNSYIGERVQTREGTQELPTTSKLGVGGFHKAVMNFQNIKLSHDGANWKLSEPQYWPIGDNVTMDFCAYAPYGIFTPNFIYGIQGNITIPADNAEIDFINGSAKGVRKGEKVVLIMKHVLTQVQFTAQATANNIVIKKLELRDVLGTGYFDKTVIINLYGNTTYGFYSDNAGTSLTTTNQPIGRSLFLIPQDFKSDLFDIKIAVTYTVNGGADIEKVVLLSSLSPTTTRWNSNEKITYNLSFGGARSMSTSAFVSERDTKTIIYK